MMAESKAPKRIGAKRLGIRMLVFTTAPSL
jgi:hypothetical protein